MAQGIVVDFIGGSLDGKTFVIPENFHEWGVAVMPAPSWEAKDGDAFPEFVTLSTEIYTDIGHGLFMMTRREKK